MVPPVRLVRYSGRNPDNLLPHRTPEHWRAGMELDDASLQGSEAWVTSHTFRKTLATLIDDQGLSARIGADQLGHAQISMTQDKYVGRKVVHPEVANVLNQAISQ
jgi:integrase